MELIEVDIHTLGEGLFGPGLLSRVYINELAKELQLPEKTIRRWWYGLEPAAIDSLNLLRVRMPQNEWAGLHI